jgi:hypothetical protein
MARISANIYSTVSIYIYELYDQDPQYFFFSLIFPVLSYSRLFRHVMYFSCSADYALQ